jgi:uncharacterized membrane protein
MDHRPHHTKEIERAVMFNDAVFAIALTLLVLELKLPEYASIHSANDMWQVLKEMRPRFGAFILSAILVGGNWISASNLQRIIVRMDLFFVASLVIYLTIISLIPFCSSLVGNYPDNPVSFVVFGGVCQLLVVNSYFFIRHCRIKGLYHEDADISEIYRLEMILWIVFLLLAGMMVVAYFSTRLSFTLLLIYNLIPFFVTRRLKIKDPDAL